MKSALILICFSIVFYGFSYEIDKKYYGNIISGGREKILFNNEQDKKNITVLSRNINVDLFEKHNRISIVYKIRNNTKKEVKISFLYPFLISSITKSKEDLSNDSFLNSFIDIQKIEGVYSDFLVKENSNNISYVLERDLDDIETTIPFKIGDSKISYKNGDWNKEVVDSYVNKYGFYRAELDFSGKEEKILQISYTSKNYYNSLIVNDYDKEDNFEDPALEYETNYNEKGYNSISDRVFSFVLFTPYDRDIPLLNTAIKVNSNLINEEYYKIQSTNFKKSGTSYLWNYRNLKPKLLHNIIIKINRKNSKETINLSDFNLNLEKKSKGNNRYYEIEKDITLTYKPETNDKIAISEIRIMPEIYTSKKSILKANKIIELEISLFDENKNLIKRVPKIINQNEYLSLLKKKNYISIFKDDEIKCKSIAITLKKVSNENEKIIINDIEILK